MSSTEAVEFLRIGFEVVVEGQLFFCLDMSNGDEDNVLHPIDIETVALQIGVAAVVDVSSLAAVEGCVDDVVCVQSE